MNRRAGPRPVGTYSIVAGDRAAGEIGVAVQSHWFSVGSVVPWAEAGMGAAATQSFVNPAYGPGALALLREGRSPAAAVAELTREDEGQELRKLAVISAAGEAAAHTGSRCVPAAGHLVGDGYSVQADMMESEAVWPAMARAFEQSGAGTAGAACRASGRPGRAAGLAEPLLASLEAAQAAGGDLRGQQSAALLVVAAEATGRPWEDRRIDLRVEDHSRPVEELGRLLEVFRAYEHMNRGDLAVQLGSTEEALAEYAAAARLCPGNLEMRFWHAVGLVGAGRPGCRRRPGCIVAHPGRSHRRPRPALPGPRRSPPAGRGRSGLTGPVRPIHRCNPGSCSSSLRSR
ncbi:MAG: DUF1028 domain-containing protein [Spirochaetales bacterium]|nr:DUF1028 domain-containing protein [Spirochaetales bacterium]